MIMKFTCLQENLAKGLSIVCKAIPTKAALPILSNVYISTQDGRLKLSATNLETAITTYVGASVEEEGSITVPAKLFYEFVSHLSPSTLEISVKNNILHINCNKAKSKLNGMDASDFPELPVFIENTPTLEVDPKVFSSAVNVVAFAAAIDESRPILGGVLLNYSNNKLTLVSTDGFRLSEKQIDVSSVASDLEDFSAVVPAKTLAEVARVFSSANEPIKITLNSDENLVLFQCEGVLIVTRILDGEYPDYKKIVPANNSIKAEFGASDFFEAVKLTNVFAKEANSIMKITLDPEGLIKVTSFSKEMGENQSEVEAVVDGYLTEVTFSSKYLLDFLNNVKTERLVFETNGGVTPGVIRPVGTEDFLHIIMPMRVQE